MPISKRYIDLVDYLKELHEKKNAGYAGDSPDPFLNFKYSIMFGIRPSAGCLVRLADKFARVASLTKNKKNDKVNESITDTLLDMAAYALIAICLLEEEEKLEQEGDKNGTDK